MVWTVIVALWAGALLGFGAAMVLLSSRPLVGWQEPFVGEMHLVDGRLVTVEACTDAGVKCRTREGELHYLRHRYWKRHAQPASTQPGQLLELQR